MTKPTAGEMGEQRTNEDPNTLSPKQTTLGREEIFYAKLILKESEFISVDFALTFSSLNKLVNDSKNPVRIRSLWISNVSMALHALG